MLKKFFRFVAEYFVFLSGTLFIFIMGIIYAFLRLEGILANLVFFLIALGWILFLIKYFWELMEKKKGQ